MTRRESNARARGLTVALVATIAGAFLLAALPAHAQRASINSLAADHDEILGTQDHGAVPISACGPINAPGSYIVTQNLAAVGSCLVVTANNVTIDLNGFVLSGDGTGNGVLSTGARFGNAVRNGTVTGFFDGVEFLDIAGAVIEGVRAVGNVRDGIRAGVGSAVTGNLARDNGAGNVNSNAIAVDVGSTVTGNTARDNGGFGITVNCPSNVIGNTATNNGNTNLFLTSPGCNDVNNMAP